MTDTTTNPSRLMDGFYTEPEWAIEIGKSQRTVMRMRKKGVGAPYKYLGKTVIYPKDAAREWINAGVITPVRESRRRIKKASPE
jgi:hypothetical protein